MAQGRVEYESPIPQGTDEGLDLWEVVMRYTTCYFKIYVHAETFMLKHCAEFLCILH